VAFPEQHGLHEEEREGGVVADQAGDQAGGESDQQVHDEEVERHLVAEGVVIIYS